jgi:putative ABC transport system substrate-binding protein
VRRRTFIAGLGSVAAWPVATRAQQRVPVIGYLSARSSGTDDLMLAALRSGLNEVGYIEGRNLAIDYRFAGGQYDRLPVLADDLTRRQVGVIVFVGGVVTDEVVRLMRASQIPIVFNVGVDPVSKGLVSSLNRPGGNMTGLVSLSNELIAKNIGLLHELIPKAKTLALLANSNMGAVVQVQGDAREAAAALGLQLLVLGAATEVEIDAAFAAMNERRPDAMVIPTSPFFFTRANQIIALAARDRVPAIYSRREYATAGGLMSYGYDFADSYRRIGNYAGRILKGERPADLPVQQPTKIELVVNLKTAKALGLTVPETLLATADEVIQ